MLDYVNLESDLSDEERMIQETAREFVEENVTPDIGDHWIEGTFLTDLIPEMGEMGFYGGVQISLKGEADAVFSALCQKPTASTAV